MLGRHGHSPPQTKRMFWCDKSKTPGIKLSRQEVGITCHCLWDNQHCMYRVNTVYRNAWKPGFVQFINNKLETNNEYLNMSKHRNIFQAWKLGVSFSGVVPHLVLIKSRFIPNTSNVWHVYAYVGCFQPQFPRTYLQRSQCEPYLKCQHILNVFVIHFMLVPKPNLRFA